MTPNSIEFLVTAETITGEPIDILSALGQFNASLITLPDGTRVVKVTPVSFHRVGQLPAGMPTSRARVHIRVESVHIEPI
jgi:hypothetical protein